MDVKTRLTAAPNLTSFAGGRPLQNLVDRVFTSKRHLAHTSWFNKTGVRGRPLGRKNTTNKIFQRTLFCKTREVRVRQLDVFLHLGLVS